MRLDTLFRPLYLLRVLENRIWTEVYIEVYSILCYLSFDHPLGHGQHGLADQFCLRRVPFPEHHSKHREIWVPCCTCSLLVPADHMLFVCSVPPKWWS